MWRRFEKIIELMIFLVRNGNIKFKDRIIENEKILKELQIYSYKEKKLDRGSQVRQKAQWLEEIIKDKVKYHEERVNGYRLKYGLEPEWVVPVNKLQSIKYKTNFIF